MKTRSSLRQQKKQTRLSFHPLASSSPTKSSYSTAVQGRLANVRFEGAKPSTRSSQRVTTQYDQNHLPTPEPSSQPQTGLERHSSPLSDAPSTPNKADDPNEEDEQTEEDDIVVPSSKRRRISSATNLETPTRRSARFKEIDTPQSDLSLRSRRRQVAVASSPPTGKALSIGSAETSGDEDVTILSKPTARRRGTQTARADDPFVVSDDYFENTEVAPKIRSRSGKKADVANDFIVGDDEIEYISSDEDRVITTKRSKNSKAKRRNRSRVEQDELEDDLENLQDSDQSDVVEIKRTRGGPVTTQRDRNREHFELLKRRRAGEPVPRISDSDDDVDGDFDEGDGADLDEIANGAPGPSARYHGQRISSDSEEEQEQELQVNNDEFYDDDDFVVDDESQPSKDTTHGIPLAFTSFASRKPRELFIHIIEWLVKNRIAPAFSRDDELYVLSWNKINDQIKAQAGSRLISAAWNEDFKNAVLARPQMQVHLVTGGHDEFFLNCDACNRTNHPARYEFKFTGQAYHKDTLEPIEDDDDSDNENDGADDGASYDQQGHLLPSAHRTYNLGRFCAANAEMGHKLTHWKYHLNESLLKYLEEQGVLSAEAIVAREKLNKKKREKEAENIVDRMQETGEINKMWQGLQDDLEDARFGMEDHVAKGGKRSQQRIGKVRIDRGNARIGE